MEDIQVSDDPVAEKSVFSDHLLHVSEYSQCFIYIILLFFLTCPQVGTIGSNNPDGRWRKWSKRRSSNWPKIQFIGNRL